MNQQKHRHFIGFCVIIAGCWMGCDSSSGDSPPNVPGTPALSVLASCRYTAPFGLGTECREYLGDGWQRSRAEDNCQGLADSEFRLSESCETNERLGWCLQGEGSPEIYRIALAGSDAAGCQDAELGCEVFGGGRFEPALRCADAPDQNYDQGQAGTVFVQPTLECKEAIAGQPPGQTDGQVCTQQWIGGCTEPGRKFNDYASCDVVRSQRGYYPVPPSSQFRTPNDDPRRTDDVFQTELAWVTSQVEACGCVCCHSNTTTPQGPSNWFLESEGIWTDSLATSGLAMLAGWTNSELLGAYPSEDNQGFSRSETGLPTNDVARTQAFFGSELNRRGYTREDFVGQNGNPPFAVANFEYQPENCENGEGVNRDGTVTWVGGDARYVHVLEVGTRNPGTPPNLDMPEGTRWFIEVPWQRDPIKSGVNLNTLPAEVRQRVPANGASLNLVEGRKYYLYVQTDVAEPLTRCLFAYE